MPMIDLFERMQQPVYQAAVCIIFTILLNMLLKPGNADTVWVICGFAYSCFILMNAAGVFFTGPVWYYFFISMGFSLLYLLVIAVVANLLIQSLKLEGTQESAMVFMVILLHPVALLLAIFLKWIVI